MYRPTKTMTDNVENCTSRLPCGLCMVMQSPCPYYFPSNTEITCRQSSANLESIAYTETSSTSATY